MADEESRDQIRSMDLNLYLGLPLPPRVAESDLGSDLALNSLPEMSSSNTQSYPSISQPYSPSYGPVSPFAEEQTLEEEEDDDDDDVELAEQHPPYLPSYLQPSPSPTAQDSTEAMVMEDTGNTHNTSHGNTHTAPHTHHAPHVEYVPYSVSYVPTTPLGLGDELQVQEVNNHAPYIPISPTINDNNSSERAGFRPYGEIQSGSWSQESVRRYRLLAFGRETERRYRRTRRRHHSGRVDTDSSEYLGGVSANANTLRDRRVNERVVGGEVVNDKTSVGRVVEEELKEKEKEESNAAANFDCNVCLDVAKEPVVTSCGHLFCWPCLYQWLHIHCDHKECPVCKGEVTEENLTPIYGRGNSGKEVEKEGEEGDLGLKIPPRPHGFRLESLRQRIQRPFTQRLHGGEMGPWRVLLDEEMHNRVEPGRRLPRIISAQRVRRDSDRGASESSSSAAAERNGGSYSVLDRSSHLTTPIALARRGADFWGRIRFFTVRSSDRPANADADTSSVVGRMVNGGSNSGASASTSVNPQGTASDIRQPREGAVGADQNSASSTIGVIQGDSSVPVDAPAEPSSVGSSPTLRRRRRNTASGSLDADGVNHACKRRRLN